MQNKPKYAILHHSANIAGGSQIWKVNEYHKQKFNMPSRTGYFVGYHYFIEKDGRAIKTRELDEEGAHTRGKNLESIGICLAGDFTKELPSEAQITSLGVLLQNLNVELGITELPLYYHFRFSDTECPGQYFKGVDWQKIILQSRINVLKYVVIWLKKLLGLQ